MKKLYSSIICILILCCGCEKNPENRIYQVSTIDALLAGVYDGDMSCQELVQKGNLGIGTFNALDGEMIILNNTVYQVKADGNVYQPNLNTKTPFASVCQFRTDDRITFDSDLNYSSLKEFLDKNYPNQNLFYAFKITGHFASIRTRSVPHQEKPYPPLSKVTAEQPEFNLKNVAGTIVGFRCPAYVRGINVPGYHFHFLSIDKTRGGHILSFNMNEAHCEIDILDKFTLQLPLENHAFSRTNLSKDRSQELKEVEE